MRKLIKPLIFLAALVPLAFVVLKVIQNDLGPDPAQELAKLTGIWALRFLILALAITPLRLLTNQTEFVRNRRMLGLFAWFYATVHFMVWMTFLLEFQWGRIVAEITPHFITRQIFCGAGKVGSELGFSSELVPFQISQRADFFEEEVGLETTLKRPIINTRDEPHADPQKYRRLHVIIGDANMSEVATFLKVGTTAIVLSLIHI